MNLINQKFGKLVVIEKTDKRIRRNVVWKCRCECGNITFLPGYALKSGNTKSCGCWNFEHAKMESGTSALNRLYYRYKKGAKCRGKTFDISLDEFYRIIKLNCFYCGEPPHTKVIEHNKIFNGNLEYNGIDRIDNNAGYITGNVVPCCSKCNYAKRDMSYSEFMEWGRKLSSGIIERDIRKELRGSNQFYVPSQVGKN